MKTNQLRRGQVRQQQVSGLIQADYTPYLKDFFSRSTRGLSVYQMRQSVAGLTIYNQTAGTAAFGGLSFSLNNTNNVSNFAAIFDQYRIDAIQVSINPGWTDNNLTTVTDYYPRLYTVIDYDDSSSPTSLAQLTAYDSCIITPPGRGVERTFRPKIQAGIVNVVGGTTQGGLALASPWLDMAITSVPHFGIKLAIEAGTVGQTRLQVFVVDAVIYYSFRSLR